MKNRIKILQKSIELKGPKTEAYARWILREILEDPEYREEK